ncbi:MAG: hypothetical protein QM572_12985 [Nocardioides sp.]|uniref:hypothetical protein n=1 Tax=Nocardioides sp. TaxID=35761 RepID=UPI0039E2A65B
MPVRPSRTAALSVVLLVGGSLVTATTAVTPSASAACGASTTVISALAKPGKSAKVRAGKPSVVRVGKRYVATGVLTATSGKATVVLTQTICPDGTSGSAASTTQAGTAVGTLAKTVKGKGSSAAKAKKALKAAERRAKPKLAATTKRKSKALATAAAKKAAADKAHHALYDSSVYWILVPSGGDVLRLTTTRPSGSAGFIAGPDGVPVLDVPAGSVNNVVPCLTKAPAWPTSFIASAAGISSPQLRAAADADNKDYGLGIAPVNVFDGSSNSSNLLGTSWIHEFDGSGSAGGVEERSSFQSSSSYPPSTYAGNGLCAPEIVVPAATSISITLGDLVVGTTFDVTSATVTGGVPVSIG